MGGLGEEHSVMKLVLGQNNWYSVPPMSFPRVQVRTMKKTMTSWYFVLGNLYIPKVTRVLCIPPCPPQGCSCDDDEDFDNVNVATEKFARC